MRTEHTQLLERREGKLRRVLGVPLAGETTEQLDRIGEQDRSKAERGLVPVKSGSRIHYKHVDDLSSLDMRFRIAAERVSLEWIKERVACRKHGASAPPVPEHLLN
jgi:hypothetical protein